MSKSILDNPYSLTEFELFYDAQKAVGFQERCVNFKGRAEIYVDGKRFDNRELYLRDNYYCLIDRGWSPPPNSKLILFRDR